MARFRERVKRTVDAICLTFPCTFDDGAGNLVEAKAGDWIVTESDGTQCVMDCLEFEETFEAIAQKGPKPRGSQLNGDSEETLCN